MMIVFLRCNMRDTFIFNKRVTSTPTYLMEIRKERKPTIHNRKLPFDFIEPAKRALNVEMMWISIWIHMKLRKKPQLLPISGVQLQ